MSWTILFHPAFDSEFKELSEAVQDELLAHAELLEQFGPTLGRPRVDTLNGSAHANMKELRFDADNGVWRVAFAFDTSRRAVLLVAGDKSGGSQRALLPPADTNSGQAIRLVPREVEEGKEAMKTLNDKMSELSETRRQKIEARAADTLPKRCRCAICAGLIG